MTDAERLDDILASFRFDGAHIRDLHERLRILLAKTQNGPPQGHADGSIDERTWYQMRQLTRAMDDLSRAVDVLENDRDPEGYDDIPF